MPKFYSEAAYRDSVVRHMSIGFSKSVAEEMVDREEAEAMKDYVEFLVDVDQSHNNMDPGEWIDIVDSTSYHTDDFDY